MKLLARFHDRFIQTSTWESKSTPYIKKILDKYIKMAINMRMTLASSDEYQVYEDKTRFFIDLKK